MKKLFAVLLAVLFMAGVLLGCGKAPSTELNQAKQQAVEQVTKAAQKGLDKLQDTQQAPVKVEEGRAYTGKAEVALYIHTFHKLPGNFITKREAERLGWKRKGTLDEVAAKGSAATGMAIMKGGCRRRKAAAGRNVTSAIRAAAVMPDGSFIPMTG